MAFANVSFNVTDNTATTPSNVAGVCAVIGITERGALATPKLVRNWAEYQREFGGLVSYSNFPLYCKLCLDGGAPLLVSRIDHYTDPTDAGTFTMMRATSTNTTGYTLNLRAKTGGTWGNSLTATITAPASGKSGVVDVVITLGSESYTIKNFSTTPTATDVAKFNEQSKWVEITSTTGTITAKSLAAFIDGDEDYSSLEAADYEGDATAQTGIHSFDESFNFIRMAFLEPVAGEETECHDLLANYAASRWVMSYYPCPSLETGYESRDFSLRENTWATGTAIDSFTARLMYGDFQVIDPRTELKVYAPSVVDFIAKSAIKDANGPVWFSESATPYRQLSNKLDIYYNLGTSARITEANAAVEAGVSPAIWDSAEGAVLWGDATLYRKDGLLKKANIAEMVLQVRRNLITIARRDGLFQPADLTSVRNLYLAITNEMDDVVARRGASSYTYQGDQDVTDIQDMTVNDPTEFQAGTYKFTLFVTPIGTITAIPIQFTLSNNSITATI